MDWTLLMIGTLTVTGFWESLPFIVFGVSHPDTPVKDWGKDAKPCLPRHSPGLPSKRSIGEHSLPRILFASMDPGISTAGGVPITFAWCGR